MGGPLVVKTCAYLPDRVGAGGSFHGGGLVTDKPDSPQSACAEDKAHMYFGPSVARRMTTSATGRQRQAQSGVLHAAERSGRKSKV